MILKENAIEQEWLVNLIQEFTENLQLWIQRHANELTIVEQTIEQIDTQDISEKSVLQFASERLDHNIQLLERI